MAQNQVQYIDPDLPHPLDPFNRLPFDVPADQPRRSRRVAKRNREHGYHDADYDALHSKLPHPTRRRRLNVSANEPRPHWQMLSITQRAAIRPMTFLQLPAEVRNKIYQLLMLETCSHPLKYDNARYQPTVHARLDYIPRRRALPIGLLRTCRQIEFEFMSLLGECLQVNLVLRSLKVRDGLLTDLKTWGVADPSRYSSTCYGKPFGSLQCRSWLTTVTICINVQAHIEHATNPDWNDFFSYLPRLRKLHVTFFENCFSDQIEPQVFNSAGSSIRVLPSIGRFNAALKGMIADIVAATQPLVELSFRIPAENLRPSVTHLDKSLLEHEDWAVWFSPRDGEYEVMDRMEGRLYAGVNMFYEHRFGRLHKMIQPTIVEAIFQEIKSLKAIEAYGEPLEHPGRFCRLM